MQVTSQMLIWVMPWLIIRILYDLINLIINGMNKNNFAFDFPSLALASVIINGACWTGVLVGFIKTAADSGLWDWSQVQSHQAQMAQYVVQAAPVQPGYYAPPHAPMQPSYYAPPQAPPQAQWEQNTMKA